MTRDELFAAAGLYVLMAFVFAYLYALLDYVQPRAFATRRDRADARYS